MPTKTPLSRARRSKAEVQNEFDQIQQNLMAQKEDRTTKDEEISRFREREIRETTQSITAEAVVQRLGTMELEVSKALSGLSAQLMAETKLLESLREAVQMERQELERLHQIDIAKTSLELLIEEYGVQKERLEKEQETDRFEWSAEKAQRDQELKEYGEDLKRQRRREEEEYDYNRTQELKQQQNEYAEAQHAQEHQNKEKQETLEKSWSIREARLKEQEDELARLRKEAADFPQRLKQETERAVAEATKTLHVEHKQTLVMAQKETETERRLAEQKIKSLEDVVARQNEEIKGLTARVEEAKNQVQEIAIKAIEGASGARALTHVNQIAMEQAKTRAPQP